MLSRLFPRRRAPARPLPAPAFPADVDPGAESEEERPLGCGWFDSSHELRSGLWVSEHDGDSAVAAGLPLALWLDLQLSSAPAGSGIIAAR